MKVALVHVWLVGMRGGERVLEALCRLYPEADIFTHVYDPDQTSETIKRHNIKTTFINRLPRARKWYQNYLPLMPLALAELDLSEYDLVISSESGPAKGVITGPDTLHVCYCHSPMRYAWDMYHEYKKHLSLPKRLLAAPVMNYMRNWDIASSRYPDVIVANSNFVARRVKKFWGRDSFVVHPPVAVDDFTPGPSSQRQDFYLLFGELVSYKRPDLAVNAFSYPGSARKLVVLGDGEQKAALQKIAGPNVTFLGRQPFSVVKDYLATCKALIFPGLEDFGIVPVEALASGTPVIAYAKGGALDTVKDGLSGVFFHKQTEEDLLAAIHKFENNQNNFEAASLAREAQKFHEQNFALQMQEIINNSFKNKGRAHSAPE